MERCFRFGKTGVMWMMFFQITQLILPPSSGTQRVQIICENSSGQITCNGMSVIHIVSARYGRSAGREKCPGPIRKRYCEIPAWEYVHKLCEGKVACDLHASNKKFGDPCPGTFKYLEVEFSCDARDTSSSTPNNSLSTSTPPFTTNAAVTTTAQSVITNTVFDLTLAHSADLLTQTSSIPAITPVLSTVTSATDQTAKYTSVLPPFSAKINPSSTTATLPLSESVVPTENVVFIKNLKSMETNISSTSLMVTWERPPVPLVGYNVSYKAIETAGAPTFNAKHGQVAVGGDKTVLQISGLEPFTTYRITVTPQATAGEKMKGSFVYVDTCRCPPQLKAKWSSRPPYTITTNQSAPAGIFPGILASMVKAVCGFCPAHAQTDVNYLHTEEERGRSTLRKKRSLSEGGVNETFDLLFPVSRSTGRNDYQGHEYIPIVDVPGFVLMTTNTSSAVYARAMASSMFSCWPLFICYILLMIISGIVIWTLDSWRNPHLFPHSFSTGVGNGIWWSFVTMTTIGYGDRYPLSTLGRVFAVMWFFIGIILNTLLVSALTSSLTMTVIDETIQVKTGKVVGVLQGSPGAHLERVLERPAGPDKLFPNLTALAQGLQSGEVDSVLMEFNRAGYEADLFNASWCTVKKVISRPFTFGIAVSDNAVKLSVLLRKYVKENQAELTRFVRRLGETHRNASETKAPIRVGSPPPNFLDPSNPLYWASLTILGGLLGAAVLGGMTLHVLCKRKVGTELKVKRRQHLDTKRELQLVVQTFHNNITRIYHELNDRHKRERKKLFEQRRHAKRRRGDDQSGGNIPTPRANYVCFVQNNITFVELNASFVMEDMSEENRVRSYSRRDMTAM